MIISNEGVTLEARSSETELWILMHNNEEGQSMMEYQELTLALDVKQARALADWLITHIDNIH